MAGEHGGRPHSRIAVAIFGGVEDLLHYAVAAVLVVLAGAVLVRTVAHLLPRGASFLPGVLDSINGVLLVVIILEILRTVLAHFTERGFPLRYFLVIGVISATRHILTVAVHLSVAQHLEPDATRLALIELLASAGVVLGLVAALFLLARTNAPD
jgi:uncharacterized membrane protein (DUF373 family)